MTEEQIWAPQIGEIVVVLGIASSALGCVRKIEGETLERVVVEFGVGGTTTQCATFHSESKLLFKNHARGSMVPCIERLDERTFEAMTRGHYKRLIAEACDNAPTDSMKLAAEILIDANKPLAAPSVYFEAAKQQLEGK